MGISEGIDPIEVELYAYKQSAVIVFEPFINLGFV